MRGMVCAETFASLAALPQEALTLIDDSAGFFTCLAWWQVTLTHAMPPAAKPVFVAIRSGGRIVALLPMRHEDGRLSSLTTPYSCEYTPLFAAGLSEATRVAAMAEFARLCRPFGVVRIDALPAEWRGLADLEAGARQAGLRILRFDHFGNWHEDVSGLNWSTYLTSRTGVLRETIRRRLRRAEAHPGGRFDMLSGIEQMDQATAVFDSVYRRSWKDPEPFPTFNTALMRAIAAPGLLRFGVWSIGGEPVAVQLWVVRNGHALVLKLAHDEAFKAHSPGTVLTALMLRHLLDEENVVRIDFGRGDDAYKQGWATQRRQIPGVLLVNPWHAAGAAELLLHGGGRVRASIQSWHHRSQSSLRSRLWLTRAGSSTLPP